MPKKIDRGNYLLVVAYLAYLIEVRQVAMASVSRYRFNLRHLLLWAMERPFSEAHRIRPAFASYVAGLASPRGSGGLSLETQKKIIGLARAFFEWGRASLGAEFKSIPRPWIESLRPQKRTSYRAEHVYVLPEEVKRILDLDIPETDLAARRDQAATAMLFTSGMRAGAFTTLPLEAVDLQLCSIRQWPELGVHTKNGKKATTFLLPIEELLGFVRSWDALVREHLPPTARWYAPIEQHWGMQSFSEKEPGVNRGVALNKRLRLLYAKAELPYRSAHKFRHGHAVYGLLHSKTMADYKSVAENLMHEDLRTTDGTYALPSQEEVRSRIMAMGGAPKKDPVAEWNGSVETMTDKELAAFFMQMAHRLAK